MEELSIEEKAKAFDEALERARKLQENSNGMILKKWLWNIFPELAESEDERIRKWIINEIKINHHNLDDDNIDFVDKAIAWLEKQGEQKPTDEDKIEALRTEYGKGRADAIAEMQVAWSEEDKRKMNRIYSILRQAADTHAFSTSCRLIGDKECIELQDFLKSIKDRVQPQPKQEWSEDEVVDAEIREVEDNDCSMYAYTHLEIHTDADLSEICKAGDKAKIIIIKQK